MLRRLSSITQKRILRDPGPNQEIPVEGQGTTLIPGSLESSVGSDSPAPRATHGGNRESQRLSINMEVGAANADCASISAVESAGYFAGGIGFQMQHDVQGTEGASVVSCDGLFLLRCDRERCQGNHSQSNRQCDGSGLQNRREMQLFEGHHCGSSLSGQIGRWVRRVDVPGPKSILNPARRLDCTGNFQ
jgi:hypothetical protein